MPPGLAEKYLIRTEDIGELDEPEIFSRYASAALHSLVNTRCRSDTYMYLARTGPVDDQRSAKVGRQLHVYFRRPGGQSHHRMQQYGEVICCCRSLCLADREDALDYGARLGMHPLRREDALSPETWDEFGSIRREALAVSLNVLSGHGPEGFRLVDRLLDHIVLTPAPTGWDRRHYMIRQQDISADA